MNTHINLDKIKGSPIFKALSRLSVLIILFIILAFTTHNFIKASNLSTILLQVAVYAVIAYGVIKTDEPRTLDFSGVRGFLVTNVCIVQRSAA